jgi:hypothetical protein
VVLRNASSRYNVEVADFTKGNSLPIFSLIFTEFESEGFLLDTTWQWEGGAWREHASSVWDSLTLEMLDWEVPATIYAKEQKDTHGAWRKSKCTQPPTASTQLPKSSYPVQMGYRVGSERINQVMSF